MPTCFKPYFPAFSRGITVPDKLHVIGSVLSDGENHASYLGAECYELLALACISLMDSLAAAQNPGFPESLAAGSPIRAFIVFPDRSEPGKLGSFSIQF